MTHFAGGSTTNFGGASPTGNFVPEIFSHKVQNFFRTASVVEGITNNDYFGEIAAFGDTVNIIKEPVLTVASYTRGKALTPQAIVDDQIVLILDQANEFSFQVDDIETKISHIGWKGLAEGSATYALKNAYDKEILDFIIDQTNKTAAASAHFDTENELGTGATGASALISANTGDKVLDILTQMGTLLDKKDVPEEMRFAVMSPEVIEMLMKTDSKLINRDFNGDAADLSNGLAFSGKLRGFSVYKTNNMPAIDAITGAVTAANILAGHMSAVATASALTQTESFRSPTTFADVVRGLHVYGRKVLRPEGLVRAWIDLGA